MKTNDLIKEIQRLPISQRIDLAEKIIHSLKEPHGSEQLVVATDALIEDYKSDEELTVFTSLDLEGFYEAK
ncbi:MULTISPECIES: hypothetical protein [unclassified Imperialibacter]|uniref:hypothetical protein n=1 Tax=unclassified Imperialibacter TaxID=2629706 RepID=UPI001251EC9D|nr:MULTISPECIES: hypothetical protein [unclassified Imperialibacter]CAD5255902.1 conserved hypothetical protein [Imperialibacter sp. 89]CAD5261990.1 conserved hypothetical protein [Imperialibacter sp. 75]VVT33000.1 conserved hypothetical protein [Imperialibacter sp. EC-SDR9]